jgi:arylsulfatase A-like enzyme
MWCGLVTGLGEGAGLLGFQQLGWLSFKMAQLSVASEILWISPLLDFLLFLALGLVCCLVGSVVPTLRNVRVVGFLFSVLMAFDWLALSGRILTIAVVFLSLGLASVFARWLWKHRGEFLERCRRSLPWLAAGTAALFLGIEGYQWLAERRALAALTHSPAGAPNVLVLVMDTVRADHISGYGYARPTSPRLDRFARQGAVFENAIATSSWTLPSHASLLTGRFPHEHGAQSGPYDGRYPSLAEEFERRGYRTGAFSANAFFFSRATGFGKGFIRFEDVFATSSDMIARTLYGRRFYQSLLQRLGQEDIPGRKTAEQVTQSVERWLNRSGSSPFFIFANYFDAHDPYLPPQPYRSRYSPGQTPGGALNSFILRMELASPDQLQGEIDAYDGAIAYIDDQIGELLRWLDGRGISGDTIVVIVSDHGESFGEHGLLLHRNALYRETLRVPLMIRWPGHVPAGIRIAEPVSLASLPATLLELAGGNDPAQIPGPSLLPLWRSASSPPDFAYPLAELAQFHFDLEKRNPVYSGAMKSVITPRWQLIQHEKFGTSLFDWTTDPGALQDLAGTPQGQRVTQGLLRCLEKNPRNMDASRCGP